MLEKILSSLEFSSEEIRIYTMLLNSGTVTAGELAKKSNMARPTLYEMLKKMRDKGIVIQSIHRGIRSFQAEPPQKINHLFETRIKNLQEQQKKYQTILPSLEARLSRQVLKPRFQMFDGLDGLKNVISDMLIYPGINTYSFWSIKSALELLTPEFFRYHNTERIRNKTTVDAIWPSNQTVNIKKYPFLGGGVGFYRNIRIAPPEADSGMGYWIYGNKTALLSSLRECYGIIIESAEYASMMKKHHAIIWKMSAPVITNTNDVKAFLSTI